jgi:hypothetical protein
MGHSQRFRPLRLSSNSEEIFWVSGFAGAPVPSIDVQRHGVTFTISHDGLAEIV